MTVKQGDIISVEKLKGYYLVVSKEFFNKTEQVMLCPIVLDTFIDALHIYIETNDVKGIVMCEQVKLVDLKYRGYKIVDRIKYEEVINITDAIQSIFDYY